MSRVDVDALYEVLEFIEKHPDQWDQRVWANRCRTQFCFAGWACIMAGDVPTKEEEEADDQVWMERANHILGLPASGCGYSLHGIFAGYNSLSDIRRKVADYAACAE